MPESKTLVLTEEQVLLKIQRIAWQIFEQHVNEDVVYLVGISKSGFWLAKQIMAVLGDISDLQLKLVEMEINKKNPLDESVRINIELSELEGKCVVLIDDVLNSGRVLIYGVRHLLGQPLKSLTTAVLVDRNHKEYPIKADVKGLSLSTSIQEHVEVEIKGNNAKVYLS
jgi:pyrimidine operon attenuation protein/uracil phosphoribosyltransferase